MRVRLPEVVCIGEGVVNDGIGIGEGGVLGGGTLISQGSGRVSRVGGCCFACSRSCCLGLRWHRHTLVVAGGHLQVLNPVELSRDPGAANCITNWNNADSFVDDIESFDVVVLVDEPVLPVALKDIFRDDVVLVQFNRFLRFRVCRRRITKEGISLESCGLPVPLEAADIIVVFVLGVESQLVIDRSLTTAVVVVALKIAVIHRVQLGTVFLGGPARLLNDC